MVSANSSSRLQTIIHQRSPVTTARLIALVKAIVQDVAVTPARFVLMADNILDPWYVTDRSVATSIMWFASSLSIGRKDVSTFHTYSDVSGGFR